MVQAALHGYMPQNFMDEAVRSEPLGERVGFSVDYGFVGAWASAMAALEQDADPELPGLTISREEIHRLRRGGAG
jgi:hypothetical protein